VSKNIYRLFREYNKLAAPDKQKKYLAALDHSMRETFKSLLNYANNPERFENIYDGWINSQEEELVVLEVYSVILNTTLANYCVNNAKYNEFIEHKTKMLTLLLENKQYKHASSLLEVYMFSEEFQEKKLDELKEKVLDYLIAKNMVLPKKLINEIYAWADKRIIPSYLIAEIEGDFKFVITNDVITNDVPQIKTLKDDVESALKKSVEMKKIVANLVHNNRVE